MTIFGNFPIKNSFGFLNSSTFCRSSRHVKDHLSCEVHIRFRRAKQSMPKKFYACGEMCPYNCIPHIWRRLN